MIFIIMYNFGFVTPEAITQDEQNRIDSLVNQLKTAGREWNDYAIPLVEIGESAVPALVEAVFDRSLNPWNRRITAMTLNDIHSPQWVKPALNILFDRTEDPVVRNQVTAGLKGFNLSYVKDELWKVFEEVPGEFRKSNIAHLLMTADTAMAYRSFLELYTTCDGYVQKTALGNLVTLRPQESTRWYMDAIQLDDWMTANMAMDSLIVTTYFVSDDLISVYHKSEVREEIKWRIVFVFGHRNEPGSVPLLMEAFLDKSWLVHTEAAVGLCRFDPDHIIPKMKDLKNDPRPYVRKNSSWVIRQME
jgi:hypothetical protein